MEWARPCQENALGPETVSDDGTTIKAFQVVSTRISNYLRKNYPGMVEEIYSRIPKEYRPFDCFSLMMTFDGIAEISHQDKNNVHGGFSVMVFLGSFTGGELLLADPDKNINYRCDVKPGDLFLCRSHEIPHSALKYEGERRLLIFVSHNNVYNYYS